MNKKPYDTYYRQIIDLTEQAIREALIDAGWTPPPPYFVREYQHFKGKTYSVVGEAKHTENGETLMIYREKNGSKLWARPSEMFFGSDPQTGRIRFEPLFTHEIKRIGINIGTESTEEDSTTLRSEVSQIVGGIFEETKSNRIALPQNEAIKRNEDKEGEKP